MQFQIIYVRGDSKKTLMMVKVKVMVMVMVMVIVKVMVMVMVMVMNKGYEMASIVVK